MSTRNGNIPREISSNHKLGPSSSSHKFREPEDEAEMLLESYAIHEDIPNQKKASLLTQGKSLNERGPSFALNKSINSSNHKGITSTIDNSKLEPNSNIL